jgi:ring-1,2-phenylacetyl-CoA epoxidase subunit PaaD
VSSRRLTSAQAVVAEIRDPEIPTAAIVEMGMVNAMYEEGDALVVEILPTFTGCPALPVIVATVESELTGAGLGPVRVITRADLPWTTAMITAEGRRQVAAFGIVPPSSRRLVAEEITCPNCNQRNVALVSRFGATPCRATARCRSCGEPLEVFKPIGVSPG